MNVTTTPNTPTAPPDPGARLPRSLLLVLAISLAIRVGAGLPDPTPTRYWDERFGVVNNVAMLGGDIFTPANGYHPSLAHLPQTLALLPFHLASQVGVSALQVVRNDDLTPLGYHVCRIVQALFGTLSLLVLFLTTRRLFAPWAGAEATAVLATVVLATVPWHVRQSAIYKPDILLLLLTQTVLWATLRALDTPTQTGEPRGWLGRWGQVGVWSGLALASKFNAAPVLVVPGLAALFADRRWSHPPTDSPSPPRSAADNTPDKASHLRRGVVRAATVLGVAGVTLLLVDPWLLTHPEVYQRNFQKTIDHYAGEAARAGTGTPLAVLGAGAASLASSSFFGPWTFAAAIVGLLAMVVSGTAWQRKLRRRAAATPPGLTTTVPPFYLLLTVAFPFAYAVSYSYATRNPSPHNWLPVSPLIAITASWLAIAALRRLVSARLQPAVARHLGRGLGLVVATLMLGHSAETAYREALPSTTEQLAKELVAPLQPLPSRVVLLRGDANRERLVVREGKGRAATLRHPDLVALAAVTPLAHFDAVTFVPSELTPGEQALLAELRADPRKQEITVKARAFAVQGPEVIGMAFGWQPSGETTRLLLTETPAGTTAGPGHVVEPTTLVGATTVSGARLVPGATFLATIPPAPDGVAAHSVELVQWRSPRFGPALQMELDGTSLASAWMGRGGGTSRTPSVKFPAAAQPRQLVIRVLDPVAEVANDAVDAVDAADAVDAPADAAADGNEAGDRASSSTAAKPAASAARPRANSTFELRLHSWRRDPP